MNLVMNTSISNFSPWEKIIFVYPAIGAKIDAPHVCHPKRNYLSSSPIKNTRGDETKPHLQTHGV